MIAAVIVATIGAQEFRLPTHCLQVVAPLGRTRGYRPRGPLEQAPVMPAPDHTCDRGGGHRRL